ncbi:MAG: helix-turn-helix domain-containing protein [Micromonosporaceae bacterium]|nr:helix-turn-helix domain-containing protein [Micromonosporaceae bacterium]
MPPRAIVDQRFAAALRRLRKEQGMSLRELAGRAYVAKSTISELENARKSPAPETAQALDQALRAGGELAGLVSRDAGSTTEQDRPWEAAELLDRVRASDVSAATVEALHATAFELCCEYGWRDEQRLRAEGIRWLREVERLLRRPVGLRQHQELLTIAGWLALVVGCVEYDLELRPAAEATRVAALELAQEGGNGEIAAWAWEMSAWFALTQGRYRDVVTAAGAGQGVVGEHTAAVQLLGQQAKALARMGDVRGVRAALERGRWLLDRFSPPARPDHHFVVDPDKWDFYAMDAYRIVGEDELARHHAEQVLLLGTAPDGTEKAPMRMAEARLTLGKVAARADDLEQAVDVALDAFNARRRSLPQLLMVAKEVGEELRRRDPRGRPVREFREAVRSLSA